MNSLNRIVLAMLLLLAAVLAGCSAGNVYEGVYEGVRHRDAVKNVPPEPAPASRLPSFQDYEAERKKLQGTQ